MKIVVVSGGFDPIHRGHIEYLYAARKLGDMLVVGVNSDAWLERKKGRAFMPIAERFSIINALKPVDHTMEFDDSDESAGALLEHVKRVHPNDEIIFANGGDRTANNIPEMSVTGVTFAFGVGGEYKTNSSSWILEEWKAPKTARSWGYYRVLHDVPGTKVKELTIEPGQSLSMQRHAHRAEYWMVTEGACVVNSEMPSGYKLAPKKLTKHMEFKVLVTDWHQLTNPFDKPCRIVEIQYGNRCTEDDIVRR